MNTQIIAVNAQSDVLNDYNYLHKGWQAGTVPPPSCDAAIAQWKVQMGNPTLGLTI
jgi:hypothetical protein